MKRAAKQTVNWIPAGSPGARHGQADGIVSLAVKKGIGQIVQLAKHPSAEVRLQALRLIEASRYPNKSKMKIMERALKDSDVRVKQRAINVLRRLQPHGGNM